MDAKADERRLSIDACSPARALRQWIAAQGMHKIRQISISVEFYAILSNLDRIFKPRVQRAAHHAIDQDTFDPRQDCVIDIPGEQAKPHFVRF
ncbi:MAG: hypothetical protein R6V85_05255 [Polyangia bacterium]